MERKYTEEEMDQLVDASKAIREARLRQERPELFQEPTNYTRGKRRRKHTRRHKQIKRMWLRNGHQSLRDWAQVNRNHPLVAAWMTAKGMVQ